MNDKTIIDNMIAFVEEKEKEIQQSKMKSEKQKTDAVNAILDKLESELKHDN